MISVLIMVVIALGLPLMVVGIFPGLPLIMVVRILTGLLIMRIPADRLFVAL